MNGSATVHTRKIPLTAQASKYDQFHAKLPKELTVNWYKSGLGKTGHQGNLGAGQILLLNGGSFLRLPYLVEVPEPSDLAFLKDKSPST